MGWNDGSVADNRENYDTIKRYMGGDALDGQFDFVWYHGVAYRVFAYEDRRYRTSTTGRTPAWISSARRRW